MAVNKIQIISSLFFLLVLSVVSCKKEAPLQPGDPDKNYLVVKDNPSDPVDHAIFKFYQETSVPVFYNDTIAREHVGDSAGIPVYFYHKLATNYTLLGRQNGLSYQLIAEKEWVLPVLPLLKAEVLLQVPAGIPVHSILLVKTLQIRGIPGSDNAGFSSIADKPYPALNTFIIPLVNPDTMTEAGRKNYVASILAKMASKKLLLEHLTQIKSNFYGITINSFPGQRIYGERYNVISPGGTIVPQEYGFIPASYSLSLMNRKIMPYAQDDLLTFLEAAFTYDTTAAFDADYTTYPLILQKFRAARTLLKTIGFRFAD